MISKPNLPSNGFTLIELLVALAVLGVFSLIAFRGLSIVIDSNATMKRQLSRWQSIEQAWQWFDQSITHAVAIRLPPDTAEAQYQTEPDPPGMLAEIWRPAGSAYSPPQRAVVALDQGILLIKIDDIGNKPSGQGVIHLIGEVSKMTIQPVDSALQPIRDWSSRIDGKRDTMPAGWIVVMELSDGQRFQRLYATR